MAAILAWRNHAPLVPSRTLRCPARITFASWGSPVRSRYAPLVLMPDPVSRLSPQTLSEADRRVVAAWAADCAERVLGVFETAAPGDSRPRAAIARLRAFARGEGSVSEEIRRRFVNGGAARDVLAPAAAAAARAAGQAAAVPHMGAHALGAAAYAAKAAGLAAPDRPEATGEEVRWQLRHMSPAAREAMRKLPPVGENASGPLGPGVLASGVLGSVIRDLQAGL